jgi:hypothetical protein
MSEPTEDVVSAEPQVGSATASARAPRHLPSIILSVVLILTLVGVVALSLLVPAPAISTPSAGAAQPDAGGSVCAVGSTSEQTSTSLVITAVTDTDTHTDTDAGTDAETVPARMSLLVLGEDVRRLPVEPLDPGELLRIDPPLGTSGWVWTGWADRATVTWREWSSVGGPGAPRGRSAAPCVTTSAALAVVPGLRTDGGNEAYLTLANPFTADATFAVAFVTPLGRTEPIALRNVSVSAGQRVVLRVNDHLPREADVAAIVEIGAGRLAVEGHQLALAGVGGIDGLTIVQASTAASTSWTLPWLVQDPSRSSWIWVYNPEPRRVTLDIVVHTASGPQLPGGFETIDVPPLGLLRLPASDLAPRAGEPFGVTFTSETTGVHVSGGLQVSGVDVESTGIATFLGSPAPDGRWLVAGIAAPERSTSLHVVNLGDADANVSIALQVQPADAAASSLRPLPAIVVAAGATARITLPLPDDGIWSVEVVGPPQLVVARSSSGTSGAEPVVTPAVPSAAWRQPVLSLAGRALEGWARRLGTDADLRPAAGTIGTLPPVSPEDGR